MSPKKLAARAYEIVEETVDRYSRARGDLIAAGLAFYGLMSAAPLALLAVNIAGLVFERAVARTALLEAVRSAAGDSVGDKAAALLDAIRGEVGSEWSLVVVGIVLWASSRLFVQLQDALNLLWGVEINDAPSKRAIVKQLTIKRLVSVMMVFGSGILLLVLVVAQALLSNLASELDRIFADLGVSLPLVISQQVVLSLALTTLFFALIYRVLPDARIPWRDVWIGAGGTAVLVVLGTAVLSVYLGRAASNVVNGALGSFAAFVLWAYYLSQVFVLGAAFTRVWTGRTEGAIRPEPHAHLVYRSMPPPKPDEAKKAGDEAA
ncbi:MAG: YihY/virulence factor BrkB family protein [Myxococcales bacterium]